MKQKEFFKNNSIHESPREFDEKIIKMNMKIHTNFNDFKYFKYKLKTKLNLK